MGFRHIDLELTLIGPVHVGNGETLGKKDYFLSKDSRGSTVAVLDAKGFVSELDERQLEKYSQFLERDSRTGLQELLDRDPGLAKLAERHILYKVDTHLSQRRGGGYQYFDVAAFVKDPYGNPYIPGSSIKGMIRTTLLCELISRKPGLYRAKYNRGDACDRFKRKTAGKGIERKALWIEETDGDKRNTRDIMHFISVSDSAPLDVSDLAFVKKYDKFAKTDDGAHKHDLSNLVDEEYMQGNDLNIYRECLRPGVSIVFRVDIDEGIDAYLPEGLHLDVAGLNCVFKHAHELYEETFLSAFEVDEGGSPVLGATSNYCYLGGGTDYSAKTIVRALFDNQDERVAEASHILYSQFPTRIAPGYYAHLESQVKGSGFEPIRMKKALYKKNGELRKAKDDHRHWSESELGVSPHTVKLGRFEGEKLQMGKCEVRFVER